MKDKKPSSKTIEEEVKELEAIFQKKFGKSLDLLKFLLM